MLNRQSLGRIKMTEEVNSLSHSEGRRELGIRSWGLGKRRMGGRRGLGVGSWGLGKRRMEGK
uniref:Uncharacterized protein n=1 Tax=Desertifilum tharense IPPAS B-1220 TaxID=1781255 RepID=A0ACD5H2S5_9CYAN